MSLQSLSEQFQPTLIFLGFLSSIFYIGFHYWGRVKLPQKDRALLASCTTSLSHGLPATVFAAWQVYDAWPLRIGSLNSPMNSVLLQYTLAYMLVDTVMFLIPYTPTDFLFCTHHMVVILYVASTVMVGRGAISCVFMLLFGECTSIWQNSWYICKMLPRHNKILGMYYRFLSLVYPASYILVRSVVGIPSVIWLCWQLHEASVIPPIYRNLWIAICLVSLAGSQIWSINLFNAWKQGENRPQELAKKLE